jgi:hypothetical protein
MVDPFRIRAYHEAGHVVIALIEPVQAIKRVTIRKYKDLLGRVWYGPWPAAWLEAMASGPSEAARAAADPVIRRSWAGIIAETKASGGVNMVGARGDLEHINELAYQAAWSDPYTDLSPYTARLRREAEVLVDAHWTAIEVVAGALLKRKSLSGTEIRELVTEVGLSELGPR